MKNIYFVGMRCTGKTTLAKALARKLNRIWKDMDIMIREEAGKSVSEIVEQETWEGFRKREQEVTKKLSQEEGLIIATGGGVLMFFDNADLLHQSGKIILLNADVELLAKRMKSGSDRPALTDEDTLKEMRQVWGERKDTYHKWADLVIDTSVWDEEAFLKKIIEHIED
jgi:shikimate kinase